jgi:hypothetical protein
VWRFEVRENRELAPGIFRIAGWARHVKAGETGFFITYSPLGVLMLSVNPNPAGEKLIEHFARQLKQRPTLKYSDRRGEYRDYTAEWYVTVDLNMLVGRLLQHKMLGFESKEKE